MKNKIVGFSGVSESRAIPIISDIVNVKGQSLIITAGSARAERMASDLSFFTKKKICVLPSEDRLMLRYVARSHDDMLSRIRTLKSILKGEDLIIIAPSTAAVKKMVPHEVFGEKRLSFKLGDDIDIDEVKRNLTDMGYERVELVETAGEFSFRGGIIDIYTPDNNLPYRIECFGTEIDSIRTFNAASQRSEENLKYVEVLPAEEMFVNRDVFLEGASNIERAYNRRIDFLSKAKDADIDLARGLEEKRDEILRYIDTGTNLQLLENYIHYFYEKPDHIWDYMSINKVLIEDPHRVYEQLDMRKEEQLAELKNLIENGQAVEEESRLISEREDLYALYKKYDVSLIMPFTSEIEGIDKYDEFINVNSRQIIPLRGNLNEFVRELKERIDKGYDITITVSDKERRENITDFLARENLISGVKIMDGYLSSGFDFPDDKLCFFSDNDIFGTVKRSTRKKKKANSDPIRSFSDIKVGDYVVHEDYGIGKFVGIQPLDSSGGEKDYIKIQYAGTDILYVPVEQMDTVERYIGNEGISPKINKLSGNEWKVTKAKAKAAVWDMAEKIIDLNAKRKAERGYAFESDTAWQKEFENSFMYAETDDQLRSAEEIKRDMERPVPMDRLLCGDVGFGKTEVAARALFKCLVEGKQAAVLVPTTILANQHYNTLKERFADFPFEVDMLSRFKSDREQKDIVRKLETGGVDLVIGTHRLLSEDVRFKDLGLLVIDEEQRFGVTHKEKIKELKNNVDVLTLSATPIPRTLNMSLSGIKDMSIIAEPPHDRYPVQTYILEQDDFAIRDIITREIDRKGQAFVIFNRVKGIYKLADKIRSLVEDAKVAVGHGQMKEHELEDVMVGFIDGEYNVLVATTIIESGIDISNANTMIVIDSDKFGLSQLYQLRGRVGRSNRLAYAYFMYQKDKVLTEVAEKRLQAIREFTEFGSGFKLAMRDMEIRGAGNLLGSQQSGHIMNIGYELYAKLIDEAVRKLKGEEVIERNDNFTFEIKIPANIPAWYVENEMLRIQLYKKIAEISDNAGYEDVWDEITDRFGDMPGETDNLLKISLVRAMSGKLGIGRIYEKDAYIYIQFEENNGLNPYVIININEKFRKDVFVHAGKKPYFRLKSKASQRLDKIIALLTIAQA